MPELFHHGYNRVFRVVVREKINFQIAEKLEIYFLDGNVMQVVLVHDKIGNSPTDDTIPAKRGFVEMDANLQFPLTVMAVKHFQQGECRIKVPIEKR
jgi:hypothetical protein